MTERTVEQFFNDCDQVNNLDRFEQPITFMKKKPSTRYDKQKGFVSTARIKLVETVADILDDYCNKWITNNDIFDRMGTLSRSYSHNLLLVREAKELLTKKGCVIELRIAVGGFHEWKLNKEVER